MVVVGRYDDGEYCLCPVGGSFRSNISGPDRYNDCPEYHFGEDDLLFCLDARQQIGDVGMPRACRVSKVLIITHDSPVH